MSSLVGSLRAPQCMSCMRRVTMSVGDAWLASTKQQVRGKKRLAKVSTVNVRLLKNVARYGKEGSVIPLPPGRMRNQFFPRRMAEYMTQAQIKEAGLENVTLERNFTFGIKDAGSLKAAEPEVKAAPAKVVPVDLDLLSGEQAAATIAKLIPKNIDFYRSAILPAAPAPKRSPSLPASSVLSEEAAGVKPEPAPLDPNASIFGSVSTSDIASSIRAILAEDKEGSRLVLGPEDITFAVETEEKGRVKNLGTYEVHIKIKGGEQAVRRTITVKPQE
ncbi:hypothetical protein VC83_01032 [Pseudogymnoascus destructans]|uniref:Ribosomal protein L9 domain-containing protein n=2 Tax=Pseudogymnoascus destructans TaxID=655981 RepID=L8FSG3_PSED2|nr:uncharacterized protein VC83_01032 [Pseudogymnoascus destructans]ELR02631.1 hypothetical protein GMDG_05592 [Pseudogymnoascus destructans 20631-21]OAF62192.1 hypothetical protein VC83_01032 [Pseudogymnoascus destructans]